MATTGKNVSNPGSSPDVDAIRRDLAALKEEIAALAARVKNTASDEATQIYESLAAQGERSAEAMRRHVQEKPLTSLAVAFALGFVASSLTRR